VPPYSAFAALNAPVMIEAKRIAGGLFALTVVQLAVGAFLGLEQFAGKGFGARLVLYPVMMLALPVIWRLTASTPVPWAAVAWIMLPFLVDVSGNTLNLYDSIGWWDDANHLVNWLFLGLGVGLLLNRPDAVRVGWALGLLITGIGAVMAIGWEVGEYFAFIRAGTELDTAYTDTLGDEVLGTIGAAVAGLLVVRWASLDRDDRPGLSDRALRQPARRARWRSPRPPRPGR
jgi:hypothetical protein